MAYVVSPQLPALMDACNSYHLHSADGWITTAGFMTAARRAGLTLSRAEYLVGAGWVPGGGGGGGCWAVVLSYRVMLLGSD